jgi:hypothetical protein
VQRYEQKAQTTPSDLSFSVAASQTKYKDLSVFNTQRTPGEQAVRTLVELLARASALEFLTRHLDIPIATVQPAPQSNGNDDDQPDKNGSMIR